MLAFDPLSSSLITLALVCGGAITKSTSGSWRIVGLCMSCTPDSGGVLWQVLRIPWHGLCICPFAVARLGLRYLVTPCSVKFRHPLRYPWWIALRSVKISGLHSSWCARRMLFALFCTVCVKKVICVVAEWAWALELTGAAGKIATGSQWVDMLGKLIGRAHRSVLLCLFPSSIILLLYQTVHLNLLKRTSHPASVKTRIPESKRDR